MLKSPFNRVAATLLKRDSSADVSCEYYQFCQNSFFIKHLCWLLQNRKNPERKLIKYYRERKCKIHLHSLILTESTNSSIPVLQNIRYKPFTIVVKLPILNVYGGPCYAPVIVLYEIS